MTARSEAPAANHQTCYLLFPVGRRHRTASPPLNPDVGWAGRFMVRPRNYAAVLLLGLFQLIPTALYAKGLRVEVGYSNLSDGVGPGLGGGFKVTRPLARWLHIDGGLLAGKEVAGADFFVGIDAGAELKPQLIPVLNGVLGVGGGLAVVSFDQIEGYGRLTAGVEFVPTSSAVALRGVLHTGIPPFPKHGAIGVMLFVGLEYRFPRKL